MSEELLQEEGARLEQEVLDARRRDKHQKWWLFGLSMLLMVLLAIIGVLLVQVKDRAERSEGVAVSEQAEKKDLAKKAQQALCGTKDTEIFDKAICEELASAAQEPVTIPTAPAPSREDLVAAFRDYCDAGNCRGQDGRSPTPDDIAKAFATFCSDGKCQGPAGKDGKALPPEYKMVLAAVTEVCADGACQGPAGKDGAPGKSGTNGTNGANATQEMVFAAVQAYCANDACRGLPGKDGADGAAGPQGISIVDSQCIGEGNDSSWQTTLSNGAVLPGGGPCKVEPLVPVGPPPVGGKP